MFSIIIAAYNEEKNIFKCLESIRKQNFSDFEVIIIDDGSKDNTYKICCEYIKNDSRFKIFKQKNLGVATARNYGMELAGGDWLMFVDADDVLSEDSLNIFNCLLQNSYYDIIQGSQIMDNEKYYKKKSNSYTIDSQKVQLYCLNRKKYKNIASEDNKIIIESVHGCYGKLYNKRYLCKNNIRFKDGLGLGEDLLFYIEALENTNNILVTSEVVYIISNNNFSSTRRKNYKMVSFAKEFSNIIYEYYKNNKKSDEFYKEMCYQIFFHFEVGITQYYTHINNKDSFLKRRAELKSNAKVDIFNRSIQDLFRSLKNNKISLKDKLSIFLLKFNMFGLYLITKSKKRIMDVMKYGSQN